MRTVRWFLLLLIPAVMLASPQSRAGGDHTGWVNDVIGYSPEDVRRFVRHRQIRRERLRRQDGYNHHQAHGQAYCVRDFWRSCGNVASHRHAYRWRYYRHGHHRWRNHNHNHRHRDHDHGSGRDREHGWGRDREHGLACHTRRRVIGSEEPNRAKAERAADNAWMGAVRYDHGERYQDLNHARDVRHNCDPSSVGRLLKRTYFRCAVEATPCRAPSGTTGERVERRYEEETDADN